MMTDLYNITGLMAADTIEDLIVVANNATGQIFIGGFLIAIFVIIIMIFLGRFSFEKSILASSFVCFLIALFLRQANMIHFIFVIAFPVLSAFTFLYISLKKS